MSLPTTMYLQYNRGLAGSGWAEIFGAVIPCILSLLWWLVTGEAPQRFDVLPNWVA